MDSSARSQTSEKLSLKIFGPFVIKKLVSKSILQPKLQSHFKIHPV